MEVITMTKRKLLLLLMTTGLLGGCAGTLTPTGDIYTEALLPVESTTVVVESYPLVAYGPRYIPAPPPRGRLRPGPYRPQAHYAAPGHHRAPGQHRAPGVKGPRTSRGSGPFLKAGHGAQRPQARGGQRPSGFSGRPQGSRGPQSSSHGPSSRGPR